MGAIPYMDVEGRGKRPLRYCQTVQDGHTAAEHLAYQALWAYARKHGQAEATGSSVVDVGLSQICLLLASDHKNVKRLLGSLEAKLAIEVVRKPDYRLATPTRYRIFHSTQILNRRREAGLLWVVRTRAVRFVDLPTVQRILGEQSMGELPMDEPLRAPGFPATLSRVLNQWTVEDGAVRQLWDACRRNSSDCTEDEVLWFCRAKEPLLRSGQIDDPAGLLLRTIPRFFANGGGAALEAFRREREREQERDRRRERQVALAVLDDPQSTEAELAWAREIMAAEQGSGRPAS